MKLGTHILSEVLNQIISIFWAQPTKKASIKAYLICWKSDLGSGTADTALAHLILPLPNRYCPCPPTPSRTPILFRFFTLWDISLIFGIHTCHVNTLYSEKFFWNRLMQTSLIKLLTWRYHCYFLFSEKSTFRRSSVFPFLCLCFPRQSEPLTLSDWQKTKGKKNPLLKTKNPWLKTNNL